MLIIYKYFSNLTIFIKTIIDMWKENKVILNQNYQK